VITCHCDCRPEFVVWKSLPSGRVQGRSRFPSLYVRAEARPSMKPEQKDTLTGQVRHARQGNKQPATCPGVEGEAKQRILTISGL